MGQMNRDCWYMYTLRPSGWKARGVEEPDQTLEIMMMDLDPEKMKIFTKQESGSARVATEVSFSNACTFIYLTTVSSCFERF